MKKKEKFIFLDHTADVKFQAFGKNLEEVFKNSALALTNVFSEDKIKAKIKENINIHIGVADYEKLLYSFLEEFLFLIDTKGLIISKIKKLKIKEKSGAYFIECEVSGDKVKKYEIKNHIKAVTYNEMFVKKQGKKYISQVVLDV